MKHKIFRGLFVFFTSLFVLAGLISCKDLLNSKGGSMAIRLPYSSSRESEGRTYYFIISLTGPSNLTGSAKSGETIYFENLPVGDYVVKVEAYEEKGGKYFYADGSKKATIVEGETANVGIQLETRRLKPTITTQPVNKTVDLHKNDDGSVEEVSVTLKVEAIVNQRGGNLTFQWWSVDSDAIIMVDGATESSLTINCNRSNAGKTLKYYCRVIHEGPAGALVTFVESKTATVTVGQPKDHTWENGKVTIVPTCKTEGEKTYTCKCGETKTETLPKEHSYVNGKCSACNNVQPNFMVKITGPDHNYYMSNTELTYEKWYEVYQWATSDERGEKKYTFINKGTEGSSETAGTVPTTGSKQPVANISWRDAVVWCNAASEKEGLTPVYLYEGQVLRESDGDDVDAEDGKAEKATVKSGANGYRLPTDAEWEYAAKGGKDFTYSGSDTVGDVAWYSANSENVTHDVGKKDANDYGMYDMSGNVWELCRDLYEASGTKYRVMRGGGFNDDANWQKINCRTNKKPSLAHGFLGFRVVRNAN